VTGCPDVWYHPPHAPGADQHGAEGEAAPLPESAALVAVTAQPFRARDADRSEPAVPREAAMPGYRRDTAEKRLQRLRDDAEIPADRDVG